jgi:hypothetical protein
MKQYYSRDEDIVLFDFTTELRAYRPTDDNSGFVSIENWRLGVSISQSLIALCGNCCIYQSTSLKNRLASSTRAAGCNWLHCAFGVTDENTCQSMRSDDE